MTLNRLARACFMTCMGNIVEHYACDVCPWFEGQAAVHDGSHTAPNASSVDYEQDRCIQRARNCRSTADPGSIERIEQAMIAFDNAQVCIFH